MSSLWARLMGVQSEEQKGWMKDNASESCLICSVPFNISTRRHHCRVCYRLVCGNCSPHKVQLDVDRDTLHRACTQCYTQLNATSLSSVRQVRSALRIENTEQILIKMNVHAAENLKPATDGGFLTSTSADNVRNAYLTISLNGKVMGTTSVVSSLNPVWNEFFQYKWAKSGPEMQYLIIEIWDKGRRVGGDELICRCRIPLLRSRESKDGETVWHLLYDAKDGRSSHSRVSITLKKGIIPKDVDSGISPPPPRPPQQHPLTTVIIPYSVKYQYLAASKRGIVELPLTQVFPPQSPIFARLFIPLVKLKNASKVPPSNDVYDDMTGEAHLHLKVLPINEVLLEAIGKVWLRLPGAAGGAISSALGTQNSGGGTVIISSGGIRSTYWLGVLLVTSHRVIFVSYPRTSKKHRSSSHYSKTEGVSSAPHHLTGKVDEVDSDKNVSNNSHRMDNNSSNTGYQLDERLNWLPHQRPGPCFPLCISMTDINTCTIKKHWKDRFTALEMVTKDNVGYIFAVERPSEKVGGVGPSASDNMAEMTAINTMRRIKDEIAWRNDEDSFYYTHDIMHTKVPTDNEVEKSSSQTPSSSAFPAAPHEKKSSLISVNYSNESTSIENTDQNQFLTPFEEEQDPTSEAYENTRGYDMNELIVNNTNNKDDSKKKLERANSPIHYGFAGPLFASSPSKNPLMPAMAPSSSLPSPFPMESSSRSKDIENKSSDDKLEELSTTKDRSDDLLIDKTPLPYPRTTAFDLSHNEFSLAADFRRQRVSSFNAWRMTKLNKDYSLCSTYPPFLYVPRYINDDALKLAASYRSSNRLPVLTWIHPLTGASLCRSSQPLVGITSAHCEQDEQLLMSMREAAIDTQVQLKEEQNIARGVVQLVMNEQKMLRIESQEKDLDVSVGNENQDTGNNDDDDNDEIALLSALYSDSDSEEERHQDPYGSDDSEEFYDDDNDDDGWEDDGGTLDDSLEGNRVVKPVDIKDSSSGTSVGGSTGVNKLTRYNEVSNEVMNDFGIVGAGITEPIVKEKTAMKSPKDANKAKELSKLISGGMVTETSKDSNRRKPKKTIRLRILDARPLINAKGNALMGKGHEILARLGGPNCTTLKFANIENIHAMRQSYIVLRQALSGAGGSAGSSPHGSSGSGLDYLHAVHDSKWLQHLSDLLKGAIYSACHLEKGDPCLIHCSDGWDRTSQLTALTQLLLEPYYRTIKGFRDLIGKDFVCFGHKFRSRNKIAHQGDSHNENSPIFIQFLDCVYQVWRQMPWEFEFNDKLLLVLAYAMTSRHTFDYSFDNWQERERDFEMREKVWYEQTKDCYECWKARTNSKTQLINEVKIEQENSSMHSFVRKEKTKNTSDLNSILEVDDEKDEEDDKGSIDDTRDIYTDHHHHQKNSGEDPSKTPRSPRSKVNANSLSVLRQRCELDAAAHGFSPYSTPPRDTPERLMKKVNQRVLSDKDLYCEGCLSRRSKMAVSIWEHIACCLDDYINVMYAPTIATSETTWENEELKTNVAKEKTFKFPSTICNIGFSSDGEIDRNFGKVIEEHARMSCSVTALDLCAFAPVTPAEHSFRTLLSSQNTFDPTLTVKTDFSKSPERDSMFTPPTVATHGTPTLFPRTVGKIDTVGGDKSAAADAGVFHTPSVAGISLFDTALPADRTNTNYNNSASSEIDGVLKSIYHPMSSIKKSLGHAFAEIKTTTNDEDVFVDDRSHSSGLDDSRTSKKSHDDLDNSTWALDSTLRPRSIRLIVPRINIQALCIWEGLHMKSLPLGANNASSSVAIQRSLEVALLAEQNKVKHLLKELDTMRSKDILVN